MYYESFKDNYEKLTENTTKHTPHPKFPEQFSKPATFKHSFTNRRPARKIATKDHKLDFQFLLNP